MHEPHGSKTIFFENCVDTRVNNVILPSAQGLLRAEQAATASSEGLATTIMHEISYGLGPVFSRTPAGQQYVRVESWFVKYSSMPAELSKALQSVSDVPVDIDPISAFAEPVG